MIPFNISEFQPRVWSIISRSFLADRIAGTYLFHGPNGSGQWAMAISLAALLNCENPQKMSNKNIMPCGECHNCHVVYSLNFEGFSFAIPIPPHKKEDEAIELISAVLEMKRDEPFKILTSEKSLNIPISTAREIKKKLSRKAIEGIKRIVVFYRMEFMKTSSADALLKLIEEPPLETVLILTTNNIESLLPTIQSRAQKLSLDRVSQPIIIEYLKKKYDLSEQKATLLAKISDHIPGQAIEMIENDDEEGCSNRAVGFFLFKSLITQESFELIGHINEMMNLRNRSDASNLLLFWQSLIRDCAVFAIDGNEEDIINIDFTSELKKMSIRFTNPNIALSMAEHIKITLTDLKRNVHIQGALSAVALKLKSSLIIA